MWCIARAPAFLSAMCYHPRTDSQAGNVLPTFVCPGAMRLRHEHSIEYLVHNEGEAA